MKITLTTKMLIILTTITVFLLGIFTASCENPIALGSKLDLEGPVVTITAPTPRATVGAEFRLSGTVSDKSTVERLLITASISNKAFAKQWRYRKSSGWEVSENRGASWAALADSVWDGSETSAAWSIPVDMRVLGEAAVAGEYLFLTQAWDAGEMSDDNSLRTIVIIHDNDPPIVDVFNPYLYAKHAVFGSGSFTASPEYPSEVVTELNQLHALGGEDWKNPALLGKFLVQEFQLQWQIDDEHDVREIDLRFYNAADPDPLCPIDDDPDTPLPDNWLYRYYEDGGIRPNDKIMVPDLIQPPGIYSGTFKGEIKTSVSTKTTIQVVARCYDFANHVSQEKTLGYFIFWPEARAPWITYPEGMKESGTYVNKNKADFEKPVSEGGAYMIYPGREIKAQAFQAQGVEKVVFQLIEWDLPEGGTLQIGGQVTEIMNATQSNTLRPNGGYSNTFSWSFAPPEARSAYYVVKATPYDFNGNPGELYEAAFRVQDISFPNFPTPPAPSASDPLFMYISSTNTITISGIVDDATKVESLYMVWINPESKSYSAMSQLSYFRDANYAGWTRAMNHSDTWPMKEDVYDDIYPNKVWKITLPATGTKDPDTNRMRFSYSQNISLPTDLNISPSNQPLKSQVFLLRAQNPDGKTTIITYAPQGDTVVPLIGITDVRISGNNTVFEPGQGQQIPQFPDTGSRTITINGTWADDSTQYLDRQYYFYNNMRFTINNVTIRRNTAGTAWVNDADGSALSGITVSTNNNTPATSGTFVITATVNGTTYTLKPADLKDTLVVNVSVSDIGGNYAENSASWLVESDKLKFLRISSTNEDQAYRANNGTDSDIKIFLEFNKPVILKPSRLRDPVLLVNATGGTTTTGIATYDLAQAESTRHFFTYKVLDNHNTNRLNVTGISNDGGTTALAINNTVWQSDNYPFTFVHTNSEGKTEEIRLNRTTTHTTETESTYGGITFFARAVPVDASSMFSLAGGKNILIDNIAPNATAATASPQGWHGAGVDLFITVTFDQPVKLDTDATGNPVTANIPYLILATGGTNPDNRTSTTPADVRVNGSQIIFKYTVKAGDAAYPGYLQVEGIGGKILDIPGNEMNTTSNWFTTGTRRLENVNLDTTAPVTPTVTVWQGTAPANHAAPPATATPLGTSGGAVLPLGNLYHDAVFVRIVGATGAENLGRIEYTLNNGTNWITPSLTNGAVNIQINNNGPITVRARQIDQAGNINTTNSGESYNITFNLDRGALVSSINSYTPNGTYTYNSVRKDDKVEIQVYFRKALRFTNTQTITLNAVNAAGGSTFVTVDNNSPPASATNQLNFTYEVKDGQNTGATPALLDVTGLALNATDGGTAVPAAFINALPATGNRLQALKQIYIATGGLTVTTQPAFTNSSLSGATAGVQADGSYNTALTVTFNRTITKNAGNITIIQSATNYRIPAVLTEAQYYKYRDVTNFDTYYTRGTNGYINASGPDTSTKYVLAYDFNPVSPTTGGQATFAEAFRQAEAITISVGSSAVRVSGQQLIVDLAGANALQVPGATYEISIPANLVQDSLSNQSPAISRTGNNAPSVAGVAKPFIRVLKKQDTIAVQTATATAPRLVATQPLSTTARMDTRTPGTTIYYIVGSLAGSVTTAPGFPGNFVASGNNAGPSDNNDNPARPADPRTTTTNRSSYSAEVDIGSTIGNPAAAVTITTVQGLRWHVRARATTQTGTNPAQTENLWSTESEEMAYRTVLTYAVTSNMSDGAPGQNFTSGTSNTAGNQVWVRGGNALEVSTIPGFPLTWQDDWETLRAEKRRAGIRLLSLVPNTVGDNLNTSTWRWVTWDANVDIWFDMILGYDPDSTSGTTDTNAANIVRQYGPRQWAMQRAGWTSYKEQYRIFAGKHRYMVVTSNDNLNSKGQVNFSGTFSARPAITTVTYP